MHPEQFCTENKNYDHISYSAQEGSFLPGPRKRLVKAVEGGRSANSILRYIYYMPFDHGVYIQHIPPNGPNCTNILILIDHNIRGIH